MSDPRNDREKIKKQRRDNSQFFSALFTVLAVILFIFEATMFGYNAAKGNTQYMVSNGILAVFWLLAIFIWTRSWKLDLEIKYLDRELEHLKHLAEVAKNMADAAEKDKLEEAEHDADILVALVKDMFPKQPPQNPADLAKLEAAFHENTDRYVKLSLETGGMAAEFSRKPFVPGRSDAHEAARLRGDASRAQSTPTAEKPLTKSQQRRINTKKGFGPLTDDELREKRNAERRAKRAAKKAEKEGGATSTKADAPLPGQTELVPPADK